MTAREQLLAACLQPFEGTFKNGERANNKLIFDKLSSDNPELYERVVKQLSNFALQAEADFVVPVPDGARQLARDVAAQSDSTFIDLIKDTDQDIMDFASDDDRQRCLNQMRGVIVEDVFNRFTNTRKVLDIPIIAERAVLAAAIFDRGHPYTRNELFIDHRAIATQYIPALLTPEHPAWEYLYG